MVDTPKHPKCGHYTWKCITAPGRYLCEQCGDVQLEYDELGNLVEISEVKVRKYEG